MATIQELSSYRALLERGVVWVPIPNHGYRAIYLQGRTGDNVGGGPLAALGDPVPKISNHGNILKGG